MTYTLDSARVLDELRELQSLTGDENGSQRVCWTPMWAKAREWLRLKLAELPVEVEVDEAGNLWATLRGESDRALLLGGHIDSVPNGGWLDGCLDLLAALEVLRRIAAAGMPPVTVRLVDWADEEGARFGISVLGSSAASGTLDVERARGITDASGISVADALAAYGVSLDSVLDARRQLETAAAYLELHIEQGPVLEEMGLPLSAVTGSRGVERHLIRFCGQTSHSGATPMEARHDAFAAAARLALAVRQPAIDLGGVATVGRVAVRPGIATAIPGWCEISLDQRNLDAERLAAMLEAAKRSADEIAADERVSVEWERIYG